MTAMPTPRFLVNALLLAVLLAVLLAPAPAAAAASANDTTGRVLLGLRRGRSQAGRVSLLAKDESDGDDADISPDVRAADRVLAKLHASGSRVQPRHERSSYKRTRDRRGLTARAQFDMAEHSRAEPQWYRRPSGRSVRASSRPRTGMAHNC